MKKRVNPLDAASGLIQGQVRNRNVFMYQGVVHRSHLPFSFCSISRQQATAQWFQNDLPHLPLSSLHSLSDSLTLCVLRRIPAFFHFLLSGVPNPPSHYSFENVRILPIARVYKGPSQSTKLTNLVELAGVSIYCCVSLPSVSIVLR